MSPERLHSSRTPGWVGVTIRSRWAFGAAAQVSIPAASTIDTGNPLRFSERDGFERSLGADIETHFDITQLWNLGIRGAGIFLERCLEVF